MCEKNPDRKKVIEISFLGDRRVDGMSGYVEVNNLRVDERRVNIR